MALFLPGPTVAEVRGSIGGTVYARNRSGMYMRFRAVPTNPATAAQTQVRDWIAELQAAYRDTLTAAQRADWQALAAASAAKNRVGAAIVLTAQNLYVKVNMVALKCSLTRIDDAPLPPVGTDNPVLTVAGTTGAGLTVTDTDSAMGAGDGLLIQCSPRVNPTVNFWKGPWATVTGVNGVQAAPIEVLAAAALAVGDRYHLRARFLDSTGRIANYQTYVVDVAA